MAVQPCMEWTPIKKKKQKICSSILSVYSSNTVDFRVPFQIQSILESHHRSSQTHFWPWWHHSCVKLYQHAKNQFVPSVLFWDTVSFMLQRSLSFFTMPHQKLFNQFLIYVSFVSTYKKWGCFIDLFWRNAWFKNPAV